MSNRRHKTPKCDSNPIELMSNKSGGPKSTKAALNYKKGLFREFRASKDITKYSAKLNYKEIDRKMGSFTKSATGVYIGELEERATAIKIK